MYINCPSKAGVSVYPRALAYAESNPLEYYLSQNAVTAERKLLPDPFSFSGVRDYRPGDPFGSINYKATARTGTLKVNRRDFHTSRNFMVYIDFHMTSTNQPMASEEYAACMERALSYTADFIAKAVRQGFSAGFAANCKLVSGAGYVRFPMRRGEASYLEILRSLAEVRITAGVSFRWLLRQDFDTLWNAEIYIITVVKNSAELTETARAFEGMGNRVSIVVLDANG
jgi:uncharacterized protein (DUF58 family)